MKIIQACILYTLASIIFSGILYFEWNYWLTSILSIKEISFKQSSQLVFILYTIRFYAKFNVTIKD